MQRKIELAISGLLSAILFAAAIAIKIYKPPLLQRNSSITVKKGMRLRDLIFDPKSVSVYYGRQTVEIGSGQNVTALIDVSTHGNGLLTVQHQGNIGLAIPIYDCHAEDDRYFIFANDMLDYDFTEVEGDDLLELHVYGALIYRDQQRVISEWEIDDYYRFNGTSWYLSQSRGPDAWIDRMHEFDFMKQK